MVLAFLFSGYRLGRDQRLGLLGRGHERAQVLEQLATAADFDTRECEYSEGLHAVMPSEEDFLS